jgi:hypothetical protein
MFPRLRKSAKTLIGLLNTKRSFGNPGIIKEFAKSSIHLDNSLCFTITKLQPGNFAHLGGAYS